MRVERAPTRSSSSSSRSVRSRAPDGRDGEVVDQDEVDLGDGGEAFAEAAVGVADAELVEQPRRAQVQRGEALPARLLGKRAGEEGLAAAGGAVDQEILGLADPVAAGEAGELGAIEPAAGAVVDVLEAGALLELRELQQAREPTILAVDDLAIDQQREALFEGEARGRALGELLGQRGGHAVELEPVQCIEGGLDEHGSTVSG